MSNPLVIPITLALRNSCRISYRNDGKNPRTKRCSECRLIVRDDLPLKLGRLFVFDTIGPRQLTMDS